MVHQAAIYIKYADRPKDRVTKQCQGNVTCCNEREHTDTVLFGAFRKSPKESDQDREEQRFNHHPEKANVLAAEARHQLANHECANDAALNAPTGRQTAHNQSSGACSRIPTTSIQPMKYRQSDAPKTVSTRLRRCGNVESSGLLGSTTRSR